MSRVFRILFWGMRKVRLVHLMKKLLRKFGFTFADSSSVIKVYDFVNLLSQVGIDLRIVYDIGAHQGKWTKELKAKCKAPQQYFLFEPNSAHNEALASTGSQFFNVALSNRAGNSPFFQINGTGDSFFKEMSDAYESIQPVTFTTKTLDDAIVEYGIPVPDLVKLDTQGSELMILRGSERALESAKVLVIECSLLAFNEGAPRIEEVIAFLDRRNFKPYSITEFHKRDKVVFQLDLIFVSNSIWSLLP
jgi:FkbM family methyltransferase